MRRDLLRTMRSGDKISYTVVYTVNVGLKLPNEHGFGGVNGLLCLFNGLL